MTGVQTCALPIWFTEPGSYRIAVDGEELSITVSETAQTGESTNGDSTVIEIPGFGIGVAVIAVWLVSLGYSRRS